MKRFPKKGRQKSPSGDLVFISIPREGGGYTRRYFGKFDDPAAHAEYERVKRLFEESDGMISPDPNVRHPTLTNYDLVKEFIKWAKRYYRKNGHETAEPLRLFESVKYVVEFYRSENAEDFDRQKLQFIQQHLDESGRFCRKGVNQIINRIRRLYRWGAENELVPIDVVTSLSLLRPLKMGRCNSIDHEPVQAVPLEDVWATLPQLSSVVADMVRLQLLTGCRPEEIRIMRYCDIKRIRPDLWHYTPSHDKTEHHRLPGHKKIVPLGPRAIGILTPRTDGIPPESTDYIFTPAEAYADHQRRRREHRQSKITPSQAERNRRRALSPKMKFQPFFSVHAYRRAIVRAAGRAGVSPWFPYQLRHTAATEAEKRLGWRAAQTLLGHKSPDTTKIYIDENRTLAETIASEIG